MFGETVGTVLVAGSNSSGFLINSTINLVNGTTTNSISLNPATRVFHVTLLSWGTAGSVLQLFSGSNATIPELIIGGTNATYIGAGGLNRIETNSDYGVFGHTFPLGCYYKCDGNIVQAAVICKADIV